MIKIISVAFILFSYAHIVMAELNCKLVSTSTTEIKLGIPQNFKLVFWPKQEFHLAAFQDQNKVETLLIESFYINKIDDTKISENNEQAAVINLEVVPLKPFDTKIFPIYTDSQNNCLMKLENVEFQQEKIEPQIIILEQKTDPLPGESQRLFWAVLVLILVILISVLIFFGQKIIKQNKAKHRLAIRIEYFKHLFEKAENRKDYEKIYAVRDEWLSLLDCEHQQKDLDAFFAAVNLYQYQKEWSEIEFKRCTEAFCKIKEVWNG